MNKAAVDINLFKACLAEALANAKPLRRDIVKRKLLKNKMGYAELDNFMRQYAPKSYKEMYGITDDSGQGERVGSNPHEVVDNTGRVGYIKV